VAFWLRRAGVKGDELRRRVTEACEMVQLSGFEKCKPNALSTVVLIATMILIFDGSRIFMR
jgi:energy-coupling factor transporter ATP-binding protein EcfA2